MRDTEVSIEGKDNFSVITKVSNLSDVGPKLQEEEVDGKEAAKALQSLQRLSFLPGQRGMGAGTGIRLRNPAM